MATSYDAKLITAKAQKEVLAVVKNAIEAVNVKATAGVPKVVGAVENNVPVFTPDGSIQDSGIKAADIQKKIGPAVDGNFVSTDGNGFVYDSGLSPDDFQPWDPLLNSLAAIANSDGVLVLNGTESAEARKIIDSDIKATEALYFALKAFLAKNGSIALPKDKALLDTDSGKEMLKYNGSAILLGTGADSVILQATIVDGKAQIYAGLVDPAARLTTKGEMDKYVSERLIENSDYLGMFTYLATEANIADAKAKIEALDPAQFKPGIPPTAIAYGDTTKEIFRGAFSGINWTWNPMVFTNGDNIYFSHIVHSLFPNKDAGRAIFKDIPNEKALEITFDQVLTPDGIWVTVGSDARLTIKKATIKAGTVESPSAFGAWNLKVDENTTIQDALDSKITRLNIIISEPTAAATDDQVVSAKALHNVLGLRSNLTTEVKDNHVVAINEVNAKTKANEGEIADLQEDKLDKLPDIETVDLDNFVTIKDKAGNVQNSGVKVTRIAELEASKISKITNPAVGTVPTITVDGYLAGSSIKLDDIDKLMGEAIRVQDIITDADIAQMIADVFGS